MASSLKTRLPDFLIVGAMKAGTTTLFRDLLTQERIYFPHIKEPNNLCSDEVLTDAGIESYSKLFRKAGPDQLCGEASTNYTKLPRYDGVTRRAREVFPAGVKILYIVREPVGRILSHHRDRFLAYQAPADFEAYLRESDHPVNVSRYAMQIEPWIEAFGRDSVHIVQLETYSRNRQPEFAELCRFLGIEPRLELVADDGVYNASNTKVPYWMATGPFGRIMRSEWYRNGLRPLIPDSLVSLVKRKLKTPPLPPPPRVEIIDKLIERVGDDAERLRQIMGRDEPLWDFDAVRKKFASQDRPAAAATA